MKKAIVLILAATIAATIFPAQSAQRHWRGTYATGRAFAAPATLFVVKKKKARR